MWVSNYSAFVSLCLQGLAAAEERFGMRLIAHQVEDLFWTTCGNIAEKGAKLWTRKDTESEGRKRGEYC